LPPTEGSADGGATGAEVSGCGTGKAAGRTEVGMDESQAREDHGEAAPLVLDAVPVPVIRYDRSLRCNLVNRAAVKASGRPTEDWIGRTNAELTGDPEVAAARDASLRQVFESRRTAIVDIPLASTTAKRALRTTVSPQFDESGEVAHVIVVATDITDLATGHEDLVEREQLLRILLDL